MPIQLLFCTCPDRTTAESIGHALVERRLAACVNVIPGLISIYRWEDGVETADEVLLLIKTRRDRYAELEAALCELHPYELPEIVAVEPAAGLPGYFAWVLDATADPG